MKRLLAIAAVLLSTAGMVRAQTPPAIGPANIANSLYAANFAGWTVAQGTNGPLSWSSAQVCTSATSGGVTFKPFVVGSPIRIYDTASPGHSENVTVTAVNIIGSGCSITTSTPAFRHYSFFLGSATGGLQEAVNYSKQSFGTTNPASLVVVTPAFVGNTANITGALGSTAISILDVRTSCPVAYSWTGSAYAGVNLCSGGGSSCNLSGNAGYILIDNGAGGCEDANNTTIGVNAHDNGGGINFQEDGGGGIAIQENGGGGISIQEDTGSLVLQGGAGGELSMAPSGGIVALVSATSIEIDSGGSIDGTTEINSGGQFEADTSFGLILDNTVEATQGIDIINVGGTSVPGFPGEFGINLSDTSADGIYLDEAGTGEISIAGPVINLHTGSGVNIDGGPVTVNDGSGQNGAFTAVNGTGNPTPTAGLAIYSNDGSGHGYLAEGTASYSRICTAANAVCGGGGGTPGGSNQQLQFNNSGSFGGASGIYDTTTHHFALGLGATIDSDGPTTVSVDETNTGAAGIAGVDAEIVWNPTASVTTSTIAAGGVFQISGSADGQSVDGANLWALQGYAINNSATRSLSAINGVYGQAVNTSTGAVDGMAGGHFDSISQGSGAISDLQGAEADIQVLGSANVTTSEVFFAWPILTGSGHIGNLDLYTNEIGSRLTGGTITNLTTFRCRALTSSGTTITNQWCFHQDDTTPDYFHTTTFQLDNITGHGTAGIVHASNTGVLSQSLVNLASDVSGLLPVANGGTGTATPSLVNGAGITITGTWPNQTIASTGSGGSSIVASAEVVAFSSTPTFSVAFNVSRIVLTGNITSFTLAAGADGQYKTVCFKQGAGPYTVSPPANVHGFFTVGTTNADWNCQDFNYDNTDSIWLATSAGVINE